MKIDSNSSQNSNGVGSDGATPSDASEHNSNTNNECIFVKAKNNRNEIKTEPIFNQKANPLTAFIKQILPNVKNNKDLNIITKPKPAAGYIYPNGLITDFFSTQAQTKPHTIEESNKLAIQYMINLQKDFGLTKEQAAGITGNLWHESSGMNAGITQGGVIGQPNSNMADDNQNGYGIAQWGGVRKLGLINYAERNGIPASSDAANYGYLKEELEGEYHDVIDAVKNTTSTHDATIAFEQAFEHATEPNMDSRLAIADKLEKLS